MVKSRAEVMEMHTYSTHSTDTQTHIEHILARQGGHAGQEATRQGERQRGSEVAR